MGANKMIISCSKCGKECQVWRGLSRLEKLNYRCCNCQVSEEGAAKVLADLAVVTNQETRRQKKVAFFLRAEEIVPAPKIQQLIDVFDEMFGDDLDDFEFK